jgi:hypothetical protein
MSFDLGKLFIEWRRIVPNGVPNPGNDYHLVLLKEICLAKGIDRQIVDNVILALEKVNPDTKITYKIKDPEGNEKDMETTYDKAIKRDKEHPAYKAAKALQDKEGGKGDEKEKKKQSTDFSTDTYVDSLSSNTDNDINDSDTDTQSQEGGVDRSKFSQKQKKDNDAVDGPTSQELLNNLNEGEIDTVKKYQDEVEKTRDVGTAGMGGQAASQGESRYCNSINNYDDKEFSTTNEGLIENRKEEIKNRGGRNKYPNAEEKEVLAHLGLNPESDDALTYLAKREIFAQQELDRIKAQPKPNVFTKGDGFGGNDKAYLEWMKAAYDGMIETKGLVEDSKIDTSKPHHAVQSTSEMDNAVEAHLEDQVENAENDEDREYYENELRLFKKFSKYHDSFIIGQDEKGRTHIVHVSNKKGSDLTDPHNNTTPAQRFKIMKETYGDDVAEHVTDAIDEGIKMVTTVREQTAERAGKTEVDENFAKVAQVAGGKYIKQMVGLGLKRKKSKDGSKPAPGAQFGYWLDKRGISEEKWNDMSDEDRLKTMQDFMNDKEFHKSLPKVKVRGSDPPEYVDYTPPYVPFGKIFIKVGEEAQKDKFWKDNPDLDRNGVGLQDAIDTKNNEKQVVKEAHDHVVNEITNEDQKEGFPKLDSNGQVVENGRNTQAYITTVMDAMHFNSYIDVGDDDDSKMIVQMGIKGAKPSHVRDCLSEKSGYGDIPPGTREGLKAHLVRTSSIDSETGAIVIKGKDGETKLAEDTWRTAGDSQKVASGFGSDMRDCITEKVKK